MVGRQFKDAALLVDTCNSWIGNEAACSMAWAACALVSLWMEPINLCRNTIVLGTAAGHAAAWPTSAGRYSRSGSACTGWCHDKQQANRMSLRWIPFYETYAVLIFFSSLLQSIPRCIFDTTVARHLITHHTAACRDPRYWHRDLYPRSRDRIGTARRNRPRHPFTVQPWSLSTLATS